jgi:hypothetical protein
MQLVPCPFCGGEASPSLVRYSHPVRGDDGSDRAEFYFISCCHCLSNNKGLIGFRTQVLAAEHWNNRPPYDLLLQDAAQFCGDNERMKKTVEALATKWRDDARQECADRDPGWPGAESALLRCADELIEAFPVPLPQ